MHWCSFLALDFPALALGSSPAMISSDYGDTGWFRRAVRRAASTRAMARLYGRIQQPTDTFVYRLSRGRTTLSSWLAGVELVMLTTTGARTGLPRTLPVLGMRDGDAIVVIASNFGRRHHPGWYYNLRAQPQALVVVAGVRRTVEARELAGIERERRFRRAVEIYPALRTIGAGRDGRSRCFGSSRDHDAGFTARRRLARCPSCAPPVRPARPRCPGCAPRVGVLGPRRGRPSCRIRGSSVRGPIAPTSRGRW